MYLNFYDTALSCRRNRITESAHMKSKLKYKYNYLIDCSNYIVIISTRK